MEVYLALVLDMCNFCHWMTIHPGSYLNLTPIKDTVLKCGIIIKWHKFKSTAKYLCLEITMARTMAKIQLWVHAM